MTRHRGPILDYRPQRSTLGLLDQVAHVLDEYADYLPLTARQVFYRLVGIMNYSKTEKAYNRLCDHLGNARRAGIIEWSAIRDDGLTVVAPDCFTGKADFQETVRGWAAGYLLDRQAGQPQRTELWCEAAGMVPQLARVADPYGIPVYSSSGFDGITAKHNLAVRAAGGDEQRVVLQVGDHDPSGVHLFNAFDEDVSAWADYLGGDVKFVRVAVTPEQVQRYGLATAPPKPTDRRSFTGETTQAEALDPATLATEVTAAIEAVTDLAALDRVLELERQERAELVDQYGTTS